MSWWQWALLIVGGLYVASLVLHAFSGVKVDSRKVVDGGMGRPPYYLSDPTLYPAVL